jgi:hypothetical protein
LSKLNEFKRYLSKKYRFSASSEHLELVNKIIEISEKLDEIVKVYDKKITKQQEEYNQRYIKFLKEKYPPLPPKIEQIKEYTYNVTITPDLITEVINGYKRHLILESPGIFKVYPTQKVIEPKILIEGYDFKPYIQTTQLYDQQPEKTNKNILITYMEMYDVNEYYNKLKITEQSLYKSIKDYLAVLIDNYITKDYKSIERQYFKTSMKNIYEFLGIPITESDSVSQQVQTLADSWPKVYQPQKTIVDYYSQDIFAKLLVSNYIYPGVTEPPILRNMDPLDLYNVYILRNYEIIAKKSKKTKLQEFRQYGILFNEGTGLYGEQAYDGVLYPVEKLDKDFATGKPISQVHVVAERDPKTGLWLPVQRTTYKRGPYAYIKRYLGTSQIGKPEEIWHEVPVGAVKLYAMDYDSCERFSTQRDCKGLGLGGTQCRWNPVLRKCKANSFGKIHLKKDTSGFKYKLSDTQPKRLKILNLRIKYEQKKKRSTLRQAAVAVKRRLVVLRTYRKNKNKKQSKILNIDIKYIDNKYLR